VVKYLFLINIIKIGNMVSALNNTGGINLALP